MDQQLTQFLEALKADKDYSDNTIAAYRNDLTQFAEFIHTRALGPVEPGNVTPDLMDAYLNDLQNGSHAYAASTVARKVAAVKSFFHFLVEQKVIPADPSVRITSPKVKKQTPRILSQQEMEQLLAAPGKVGSHQKALRDSALLALLYATGLRVTEVVNLRLEDVDWEAGTVTCRGKGGRQRQIPLGVAQAIVTDYLKTARPTLAREASPPMLFLNHRGQKLTRQGVWLIIKEAADLAGIGEAVTPHTLRHSFAKHLLGSGEDVRRVQELLGHANLSTTQVYRQLSSESAPDVPA